MIMHTRWDIFGTFVISLMVSYGFTPMAIKAAFRLGYLDQPENKKAHLHATPLLGGVAISIAILLGIIFSIPFNDMVKGILMGAAMLFVLGLIDDKLGMMPQLKLSVQAIAALTVFKFGLRVTTIEDYYLCMAFTIFWIVGITNAMNLLDNLNGLSSGIAAIASAFFCLIAFIERDYMSAALAAGITGACMGFLKYNFPRAQIFMGDTGSLVLGFLLASLAIMGSWKTDAMTLSLSIPFIILAYPIFDTTLVTIIRIREGRSIFQGGRDHSSHILAYAGFKKKRAVLIIFLICFLLGISALAIRYSPVRVGFPVLVFTALAMAAFGLRLLHIRSKMVEMRDGKQRIK